MPGHSHHHTELEHASDSRIIVAFVVNFLLTIVQIVAGALSGSVALIADALHNLNDALSIVVVLIARRVSRRQPDERRTFGYRRSKVVGGLINLVALVVVGLFLAYESIMRLFQPQEITGWLVIAAAGVALVVDGLTVFLFYSMREGNINLRAAFVHKLADALASVVVLLGGVAILLWNVYWLDPLLSLLIVAYILVQGYHMIPDAVRVVMESAPEGFDMNAMTASLKRIKGVQWVHHVHVWQLDEHYTAMEAHIVTASGDAEKLMNLRQKIKQHLAEEFDVTHATLELEPDEIAKQLAHSTTVIATDDADEHQE